MYVDTPGGAYVFAPSALTDVMNAAAVEEDFIEVGLGFYETPESRPSTQTTPIPRVPRDAAHKKWSVTRQDLDERALSYGLTLDASHPENGTSGTLGNTAPGT